MTTAPATVVVGHGPNIFLRILWFLLVGWWASLLAINVGWLLNVTIVGLPVGLMLLNRIPTIATLKPTPETLTLAADGTYASSRTQRSLPVRALYFLAVGWWASLLWLNVAWLACISIIGLPLGFWMFGAAGKLTTLRR